MKNLVTLSPILAENFCVSQLCPDICYYTEARAQDVLIDNVNELHIIMHLIVMTQ